MKPEDLLRTHRSPFAPATETSLRMCKSCHKMIARSARTCPKCGHTYTTAGGILIAIIVAIILAAFSF